MAIAEQHSINVAAGMACDGLKPVVAIYSTFLQRGYDQVIHDVVNQNLPVLFALDRAGLVGADGPTHNGSYDISFLRCLPNITVMTPANENECRQMLYTGFLIDGPAAVRYPRGTGPGVEIREEMEPIPLGKATILRKGSKVALLAFGSMVKLAEDLGAEIDATVVNMRFVKPIDDEMIREMASSHDLVVTIEENVIAGGAGSAVSESLVAMGITASVAHYGLPDRLVQHGSREDMLQDSGLNIDSFREFVMKRQSERGML